MKRSYFLYLSFFISVGIFFTLSCNNNNDNKTKMIIGKWKLVVMDLNNTDFSEDEKEGMLKKNNKSKETTYSEFTSDGIINKNNQPSKVKWNLNDEQNKIIYQLEDGTTMIDEIILLDKSSLILKGEAWTEVNGRRESSGYLITTYERY